MPPNDDPVALRSPAMCRFFAHVMSREVGRGFRGLRLARPGVPELPADRPLIVYSNHPSWWDPAVFIALATRLFPEREGYGPMEEAYLERYRFMRRIGIFGIDTASRAGAARFLRLSERILSDPERMLWITAQGTFRDPRDRPLELRAGLAHLMARRPDAVALPLALEYPFWSEKRPEALAAFGTPLPGTAGRDARAWRERLDPALARTMDHLADLARRRDTGDFDTVVSGARGVGGPYGAWSRLRARLGGRPHDPDHMTQSP